MNFYPQESGQLYNQLPCGYHSLDQDGNFVRINNVELQMLGYSREEVIGRKFTDFINPESLSTFEQNFPLFKQSGWINDLEFQIIRKDGTNLSVAVNATVIRDEAGNFLISNWIVIDISDRKCLEAQYQKSEAKYRSLFNTLDEGFHMIELIDNEVGEVIDYRFLESNPAFEQQTGLKNTTGKLGSEIAPTTESYWLEAYDRVARTGEPLRIENYNEDTQRWYTAHALRVGGAGSRQVAILFSDISERKLAEAQLRRATKMNAFRLKLSETLRSLADPVQIQAEACRLLGKQLEVDRAYYVETDLIENCACVHQDYIRGDSPSLVGVYSFDDYGWTVPYLQQGETIIVADTETEDVIPAAQRETMAAIQIRSHISLPIIKMGKLVGALCVTECVPREWTAEEVELVGETAERMWADIQRAYAEAVVADNLRDTQQLRDLSTRLTTETDLQVLYNEIVATAISLTRADGGTCQILDEATQELVLLATQGFDRTMTDHFKRVSASSNTPCGIALATNERTFVDFDVPSSADRDGSLRMHVNAGYLSAQSTPLITRLGKPIGMISTHWHSRHRSSDRELRFLDLLARQAADLIEQRQSELEIRKFVSLADNSTEFISMCDLNFVPFYLNHAGKEMVGLDETCQYKEIPVSEFFFPEDREFVINDFFPHVLREGRAEIEIRFRHFQTGEAIWMLYNVVCLKDSNDQLISLATISRNISNRKQVELNLQQQIAKEHLLAEIIQSIHQTFDIKLILQNVVEQIRQFLQTDRVIIFRFNSDWSGQVASESVASEFISILDSEINDPCLGEQYIKPYSQGRVSSVSDFDSCDLEPCYQTFMAQFQVKANLVVPILQREKLWGLLIVHHCRGVRQWLSEDIELLKQLATQLGIGIQQAQLYQKNVEQAALIDIASDAIFVRDLANRILFWSQGAERLYGWTAEEVRGRIANELFYRESFSQLQQALNTTIESGSWSGELKQRTKKNQEITVLSRWTLMPDGWENPQLVLVVNTDITEKKQLEQQLLHAQRLESIGTLAGGIAHDLNNILTPILSLTRLLPLYNPNLDESSAKMLEITRASALRGANIVKQVLLFAQRTQMEWELLSVGDLIEEILKLIREIFPKSIAIKEDIAPNLGWTEGDSTQLHQLLMNLCVNARDAMPDGGKLTISAKNIAVDEQFSRTSLAIKVGNYIAIAVSDTGMGIPPEIIERIFDPFFTTKEPGKGTGLGLSTAIGIVKNHGGTIEVSSDRRSGTQFRVYLPVIEAIATTETINAEIPFGRGELILVVDDEEGIREVTKATLEAHNYRVITASDGLEAIAIYARRLEEIEVVLMDLVMPEMDGLTAMRALKKINPDLKLIATTGMATKKNVSTAKSLGIESFLLKPYTTEDLLLCLNRAIAP